MQHRTISAADDCDPVLPFLCMCEIECSLLNGLLGEMDRHV